MTYKPLSAEQIALLHHVELSEAGWRQKVVDQFVLAVCLQTPGILSEDEIRRATGDALGVASSEQVRRSIERLRSGRHLVEVALGRFGASEAARQDALQKRQAADQIERAACLEWEATTHAHAPELADQLTWRWFGTNVLEPLVRTQGVRIYELLTSQAAVEDSSRRLLEFLDDLPPDSRSQAHRCVEQYLASSDASVRQYILRQLHAHLLSLAAGLPSGSLETFQGGTGKRVELKLLLDTNFLFSLLGLHDNPSNEAAADFVELLEAVKGHVDATLYVTPLTIDEVKRTLGAYERKLGDMQMTPKLGVVASELDGGLSGIAVKFFEAARNAKKRLSVSDYLGPYLRDLLTVLRSRGIELYNESMDDLSTSQPVVDDILAQQAFEEGHANRRAKTYEALRHDVTLWHLVLKRRPARVDAPLDAVYWIATVDYRLLGFDLHKRRGRGADIPICVHPSALVQMLQLWLPRSPKLNAALFESLRASLPNAFDSESEEMSIRILRALSRYEDVDDLPAETLTSILVNKALRVRMTSETEIDRQAALVRDEIVQAAALARSELAQEKARASELASELERLKGVAAKEAESAGSALARANQAVAVTQVELEREREEARRTQERLTLLERSLESESAARTADQGRQLEERAHFRRSVFSVAAVVLCVLVGIGVWYVARRFDPEFGFAKAWLAAVSVGLALWLTGVVGVGDRITEVRSWGRFVGFRSIAVWLGRIALVLASGVGVNALWDWIKA